MKIYAIVGFNEQVIDSRAKPEAPEGYIEMLEERPMVAPDSPVAGEYVAKSDGTWEFVVFEGEAVPR